MPHRTLMPNKSRKIYKLSLSDDNNCCLNLSEFMCIIIFKGIHSHTHSVMLMRSLSLASSLIRSYIYMHHYNDVQYSAICECGTSKIIYQCQSNKIHGTLCFKNDRLNGLEYRHQVNRAIYACFRMFGTLMCWYVNVHRLLLPRVFSLSAKEQTAYVQLP